uniref:Uncharacterized protein n=1 Tax=Lepeophtheirus salmonis TaxID=72036 RepID=A0A0K2UT89_LEPSM
MYLYSRIVLEYVTKVEKGVRGESRVNYNIIFYVCAYENVNYVTAYHQRKLGDPSIPLE